MSFLATVAIRAADIADEDGLPIARWQAAGGFEGGLNAAAWLSVAFLFARYLRDSRPATI